MAESHLILRRDKGVPLPNETDQEIVSATNNTLCHQKSPAQMQIMNVKSNAKGAITAITNKIQCQQQH
jgi:hypothetical protein